MDFFHELHLRSSVSSPCSITVLMCFPLKMPHLVGTYLLGGEKSGQRDEPLSRREQV